MIDDPLLIAAHELNCHLFRDDAYPPIDDHQRNHYGSYKLSMRTDAVVSSGAMVGGAALKLQSVANHPYAVIYPPTHLRNLPTIHPSIHKPT